MHTHAHTHAQTHTHKTSLTCQSPKGLPTERHFLPWRIVTLGLQKHMREKILYTAGKSEAGGKRDYLGDF